jgi:hypothetical protein
MIQLLILHLGIIYVIIRDLNDCIAGVSKGDGLHSTIQPGSTNILKVNHLTDSPLLKESIADQTADSTQQPQIVTGR